jgi:hypothetical protein
MSRLKAFSFIDLDDVAGGFWLAIRSPCFHEFAALLQRVTAAVGLFGFVTDDMRQRSLGDFAGEV